MAEWKLQQAKEEYQKNMDIWNGVLDLPKYVERHADGLYHFGKRFFDPMTKWEDIQSEFTCTEENVLFSLFYAYLDTINANPYENSEDFGYYDENFAEDNWNEQFNDFVADIDPDTVLVTVDCHS